MTCRLFHYLCVCLLLIAQQGALVHAAWHARVQADEVFAYEQGHERHQTTTHEGHDHHDHHDHGHDGQASLCAFDLAFGQVLGGASGSSIPVISVELPQVPGAYPFVPRCGSDAVAEVSRGPPAPL